MATPSRGTQAVRALEKAGVAFGLHVYDYGGEKGGGEKGGGEKRAIGLEAANALDLDPARVFKTLVAELDGDRLAMAIVPVAASLDLKALARILDARRAAMADVGRAERATGYVKGGISPFGQRKRHRTFLDATTLALPTIIVNGGRRGLQIELAPADLLAATAGTATALARVI